MDVVQKVEIVKIATQIDWTSIIFGVVGTILGAAISGYVTKKVAENQLNHEVTEKEEKKIKAIKSIKSLLRNELIHNYRYLEAEIRGIKKLSYFQMIESKQSAYCIIGSENKIPFEFKEYNSIKIELIKYLDVEFISNIFYIYDCLNLLCITKDFAYLTEEDYLRLSSFKNIYDFVLEELKE